jgi:hypothetical protein
MMTATQPEEGCGASLPTSIFTIGHLIVDPVIDRLIVDQGDEAAYPVRSPCTGQTKSVGYEAIHSPTRAVGLLLYKSST